jgi:hypothetical protein
MVMASPSAFCTSLRAPFQCLAPLPPSEVFENFKIASWLKIWSLIYEALIRCSWSLEYEAIIQGCNCGPNMRR